jgi:pantoate--beta-alanine ligase
MQILSSVTAMQALAQELRAAGRTLALVPTMGALHEGHLSLMRTAAERADCVIVSLFVNPTQFGPNEDFSKYPRELESDLAQCEATGVEIVFTPDAEALYPAGYSTYVVEENVARPLEGETRPHHFRGVTTVVAKLFNIIRPHCAVFGQKDAQQAAVIRKMVADLHYAVEIVIAPTQRDKDGLALSSRNRYLSPGQRLQATAIARALDMVRGMVERGELRPERLIAETTHVLSQHLRIRIIYVSLVDRDTMEPVREVVPGRTIMVVAAWVDEVRLIDNVLL